MSRTLVRLLALPVGAMSFLLAGRKLAQQVGLDVFDPEGVLCGAVLLLLVAAAVGLVNRALVPAVCNVLLGALTVTAWLAAIYSSDRSVGMTSFVGAAAVLGWAYLGAFRPISREIEREESTRDIPAAMGDALREVRADGTMDAMTTKPHRG